eukprot:SAG31_NODE_777_length_12167_cov_6.570683_4_plen_167_part_00
MKETGDGEIIVKARKSQQVNIGVRKKQQVEWQLRLEEFDIGASIVFVAAVDDDDEPFKLAVVDLTTIGNPQKADEGGRLEGNFVAPADGQLILILENSYSKLRHKRVLYKILRDGEQFVIQKQEDDTTEGSDTGEKKKFGKMKGLASKSREKAKEKKQKKKKDRAF